MEREQRTDRITVPEGHFAGYDVYDQNRQRIGEVESLFLDENDQPEYIGVKMGVLGSQSTLIPMGITTIDEEAARIVVPADKDIVMDGPTFDEEREITPEDEDQVRSYYGLGSGAGNKDRGTYGSAYGEQTPSAAEPNAAAGRGMSRGGTEGREVREHGLREEGVSDRSTSSEHGLRGEGVSDRSSSSLQHEDETRIQRSEEELRVGTRKSEAKAVRVRKRIVTERQRIDVPKTREEVTVERVPVEARDAVGLGAEIGEDEIVVPVTEEEIVVEKRPVVKEEIRIRKDVVHEEEVIEADVRKEEIDIDDQTTERDRQRQEHSTGNRSRNQRQDHPTGDRPHKGDGF
jgi:uncharacterized protein (TIGR02271 family)